VFTEAGARLPDSKPGIGPSSVSVPGGNMQGIRTKLGLATTAIGAVGVFIVAGPAGAAAGTGTVVGHGTISPGLTNTPTYQHVSFIGTLVAVGTKNSGTYSCVFTGASSIKETSAKGKGTARGNCTGSHGSATATVNYTRNATNVVLAGVSTGAIAGHLNGDCNFVPTSAPTTKNYQLQCSLVLH
jgi:hypothetical protein